MLLKFNHPYKELIWVTKIFQFQIKALKYKRKFISWMWRARERIARRSGHPDRMWENIEEADGDLEVAF
jgi:hypothetical protein